VPGDTQCEPDKGGRPIDQLQAMHGCLLTGAPQAAALSVQQGRLTNPQPRMLDVCFGSIADIPR
jgi:hypothetical protein